ncbi:MAG: hypothetical protein HUU34_18050 [Saprospiraceae bacterium]|nr:hypothetical protein [Saprospiraceae bacterium]
MKLSAHFSTIFTIAGLLSFNLLNGQTTGDYRSAATGNWNVLSTWERYDGSNWLTPTMTEGTPTNANGLITIKSPHIVTATADVSIDQTTIEAGGEVIVNSGVNLTIINGTGTYDLTVNGTITNSGAIIKATSIIQIGSGGVYDHARDGGSIPGASWNSSSTCEITGKVNNNITGLNQTFGHLKWNSPGQTGNQNLPSTGQIFVSGDFEISDTGTGELRLNQDFLTLIGDFTQTSGHFRMANADNSRIITVNGNFSMSGGTLEIASGGGGAMGDGIFELYGDFSFTGGSIEENTGSTGSGYFIFVGAAPQQYVKSGGAAYVDNIHFYIASGTEVSFGTSVIDGTTGDFILDPGGQLTTANSGGVPGTILVGGSKTYSSEAAYEFQGSNTGVFTTTPDANTISSLIVNSPAGLSLDMPLTVNTVCLFIDGILTTTSINLLTFSDEADYTGAGDDTFVDGPVQKIGDDAFTFPIGNATNYAPIGISAPAISTDAFTAEYFNGEPSDLMTVGAGVDHISSIEYWDLDRTAGASNIYVTLNWRGNSAITDVSGLLLTHYNGMEWENIPASTSGDASTGSITSDAPVTSFSFFTLGSSLALPANPLPIELINFNATPTGNHVLLEWSTATETDNDFFVIEKTKDGVNFEEVAKIDGAGNSSFILKYQTLDENPYPGKSYYRLQQVDFSGHFSYSDLVQVSFESNGFNWNLFPNPTYDHVVNVAITISGFGEIELSLVDITGKIHFRTKLSPEKSAGAYPLSLPANLAPGAYFFMAASNGETIGHKPLIIK